MDYSPHQGEALRAYFAGLDLSLSQIQRKMELGSRNTLLNWLAREKLNANMMAVVVKHFPDAAKLFPSNDVKKVSNILSEPGAAYGTPGDAECRKQLGVMTNQYLELVVAYNDLVRQNADLLAKLHARA
jgi:hypothetical protein